MSILEFQAKHCKDCYKCVRHCPVKAIEIKDHTARVIENECILCGTCITVCPQNAKKSSSDLEEIMAALDQGQRLVLSAAPSWAGFFPVGLSALARGVKQLGFAGLEETAEGAYLVKEEYQRILREKPGQTWLTSCCPAVNQYIQKHRARAQRLLLPVLTPAQAHAKLLKQRDPQCRVVFLSPCVAKKGEQQAAESDYDYVLLFEELRDWLHSEGIVLQDLPEDREEQRLSRQFPVAGGVLKTMERQSGWQYLAADGFEQCAGAIDDALAGRLERCLVELNFCQGGCAAGPSFQKEGISVVYAQRRIRQSAGTDRLEQDYRLTESVPMERLFQAKRVLRMPPAEAQITAVLRKMGKEEPGDELNCGMCGYPTCREKAKAVLQGKAEIGMCVPYMRRRAESFANTVVDILPTALLSVNRELQVQQINQAACKLFHIEPEAVLGQPVSQLLDEYDFINFLTSGQETMVKKSYLADYNIYLEESFHLDRSTGVIVITLKDLSKETRQKQQNMQTKLQAASLADEIVNKQLRIVHEIAFLLGETAAETKTAVKELKDAILEEGDDR